MRRAAKTDSNHTTKAVKQRDALADAICELIERGYVIHDGDATADGCPGCRIDKVLKALGRFE